MGLTVGRKTAKNLSVWRRNERVLTVSRKKKLTVKKLNHKIRSRDLLLCLMCYVLMWSGITRITIETGSVESVWIISHGCRCASWHTFWQLYFFTTFYFLPCWLVAMAVFKAIVSVNRAAEKKPIERHNTRVKVTEENKLFSSSKIKYYRIFWAQRASSKVRLEAIWNFTAWRKSMAKRRITPYQLSRNWSWNCPPPLAQIDEEC